MSYTSAKSRPSYQFDSLLEFKDAGLIASSGPAKVDSAEKIVDVGSGAFDGDMVIDVSAIEVATGDEGYHIQVQGSDSATFASGVERLASLTLGDSTVTGGSADNAAGRRVLPFNNRGLDGKVYRYLRIYVEVEGTIATGINFTAFASPRS